MMKRRELIGVTGVVISGSTAGCLDMIPFIGDDPIKFESTRASIPDDTLQETGYELNKIEDVVIERTYEVGGQSQDVVVTNWQTEYDKAVDLGEVGLPTNQRSQAAIFTALTTPQVNVLGRTFNPVADMDSKELAEMIQDRYEGLTDIQQVGEQQATVSGESTKIGEFETEAELVETGATIDLTLHIAEAIEVGDDLIVAIGGYPKALRNLEFQHTFTLMESVRLNAQG